MKEPTMGKLVRRCILFFFIILLSVGMYSMPLAQGPNKIIVEIPNYFLSGNKWRDLSIAQRVGYSMGVLDGMIFGSAYERKGWSVEWVAPCLKNKRSDQMMAIFQKELDKNPELWDAPMYVIVHNALNGLCKPYITK